MSYLQNLQPIRADLADMLGPPLRISVSEAARRTVRIMDDGGYAGTWDPNVTPYMVEPMDTLAERRFRSVIFVGPSRSGKTQALIDGWLSYMITANPGDFGAYFPTEALAMDFRKRRIERLHKHSPEINAALSPRGHDNALGKVIYRNGMILDMSHPTSGQVAQRTFRYVAASDFDSFPDNIAGEGNPYTLILMRTQTAGSAGMGVFESSPKRMITKSNWKPKTPHEAPPVVGGVIPLYNNGDRRRWYWQCIDGCGDWFEAPAIPLYEPFEDPDDAGETAHVPCPHCGTIYRPDRKRNLNLSPGFKWHPENAVRDKDNNIQAPAKKTRSASFWLKGCAAAFQTWQEMVHDYVVAKQAMEESGDDRTLISVTNTKLGMPYLPPHLEDTGLADALAGRKVELERYYVPPGVRVLIGTADIQADRFEVAVWGFTADNEMWLVDRYPLRRTQEGGPVKPHTNLEHWNVLTEKLINGTYRLMNGKRLRVAMSACDSGGLKGATGNSYAYWRNLKKMGQGNRLLLSKGEDKALKAGHDELVRISWPDTTKRKDRLTGGTGDVPLMLVNANQVKDIVQNRLSRDAPGPGYIYFPEWVPPAIFDELTAESKVDGKWVNQPGRRNETFDLIVMAIALWSHIKGDRIDWNNPPSWAAPMELNTNVLQKEGKQKLEEETKQRVIKIGREYHGMIR